MPELTFVIPVATYHTHLAQNAIDSVLAQTVPCNVVTIEDKDARGAGWARNQGLRKVTTPFVSFLDADDTIAPEFAEYCLQVWGAAGGTRYVYTNWIGLGGRVIVAAKPCDMWKPALMHQIPPGENPADYDPSGDMWTKRAFHPITTLIPAEYARRIGGFDEQMSALEDSDFYKRLIISGVCGIHLNAAVFTYQPGGQRSTDARIAKGGVMPEQQLMRYMDSRYGGYSMGCCGEPGVQDNSPQGEKHDGDVLAMAMWNGNDRKRGLHTGRIYPRTGNGKICYVDPLDVAAAPHQWKKVSAMPTQSNPALQPQYQQQTSTWQAAGNAAFGGGQAHIPQPQQPAALDYEYKPVENPRNLTDKLKLAQRKTE